MSAPQLDIPPDWADAVESCLSNGWRKLIVIGAANLGKSTLCGLLAHSFLESGRRVAIVDSDLGQKLIGPPACVTLGYPAGSLALAETELSGLYFVGGTSPARHLAITAIGAARLVQDAEADVVIVNTGGMLAGPGIVSKTYKLEAIRPDAIVALAAGRELGAILAPYRYLPILRLRPSPLARVKTASERDENRRAAFARYFSAAEPCRLRRNGLIFQRARPEGLQHLAPSGPGLLCGLADESGCGRALGLITEFEDETIGLLTPPATGDIRVIQFGSVWLTPDGREHRAPAAAAEEPAANGP